MLMDRQLSLEKLRLLKSALWICFFALLAGLTRCHNLRDVFVENRVYFLDADCYSRMTRARMIVADFGTIVRHHDFENFPQGIEAHTTAPLDYLIIAVKWALDFTFIVADRAGTSVLRAQTLDLAGALISPLLGVATCLWLGIWAKRWGLSASYSLEGSRPPDEPGSLWLAVPLFFAVNPILVHGTVLGRPDHQSLLILVIAVALGAESRQAAAPSRLWALVSGVAWAFALWVSFYEPVVLLAVVLLTWAICKPRQLVARERLVGLGAMLIVGGLAWGLEGWRIHPLGAGMLGYLENWNRTIGELGHPNLGTIFCWLGWSCLASPVLLILAARNHRRAFLMLALVMFMLALTVWQLRWGYFLALVFAMTLPWQLAVLRRGWIAWAFFFVALWPIARAWDEQFFPNQEGAKLRESKRAEGVLLREIAGRMRTEDVRPFLAPWWISPALAYWSGQPGVAGSSHESLAGIVDTARFYLSPAAENGAAVLRARQVKWLVADDPWREIETSRTLLGIPAPDRPLATLLVEQPHSVAPFLHPVFANDFFKLFAVDDTKFPDE